MIILNPLWLGARAVFRVVMRLANLPPAATSLTSEFPPSCCASPLPLPFQEQVLSQMFKVPILCVFSPAPGAHLEILPIYQG